VSAGGQSIALSELALAGASVVTTLEDVLISLSGKVERTMKSQVIGESNDAIHPPICAFESYGVSSRRGAWLPICRFSSSSTSSDWPTLSAPTTSSFSSP
jgi:hypothetical protein